MGDTTPLVAAAVMGFAAAPAAPAPVPTTVASAAGEARHAELHVGVEEGDLRGSDHRALQAAVDYIAGLGGGTVHVGPGRYLMRNALILRDHVRVAGVPDETILAAADGACSLLACDGDCNERQITLAEPSGFRVGDGVAIADRGNGGGFGVTTATLTAQMDERSFRISAPLYFDYMVAQGASARRAFPVVGGWQVKDATVEGLTIEGNRERAEPLDGCRGGGIYLFECEDVTIRRCTVRGYNGDGISFQVSNRVTVEECLSERNAGLGLHPGSGSQQPRLRGNRSLDNDRDGLYVCWRVKHGLFEDNEIRGNRGAGISIGHKDTDNEFRRNTITGNGKWGVLFRPESEAMGAHRNSFEQNTILDNGSVEGEPCIDIRGPHHDLIFRDNTIGYSQPPSAAGSGIRSSREATGLNAEENRFLHVKTPIDAAGVERE
jgi:parallel beta-helix repeat protein